jgi:hypothetical protein
MRRRIFRLRRGRERGGHVGTRLVGVLTQGDLRTLLAGSEVYWGLESISDDSRNKYLLGLIWGGGTRVRFMNQGPGMLRG